MGIDSIYIQAMIYEYYSRGVNNRKVSGGSDVCRLLPHAALHVNIFFIKCFVGKVYIDAN